MDKDQDTINRAVYSALVDLEFKLGGPQGVCFYCGRAIGHGEVCPLTRIEDILRKNEAKNHD